MLIGITGYKRNGKDSLADRICESYGYTKYSFAGKMKECLEVIFGWTPEYIEAHKEEVAEEYGISPRQFLQVIGTEFAQYMLCEKYPEFKIKTGRKLWAKGLLNNLSDVQREHAVISDMRFPHEAEEVRRYGGKIIRVNGNYLGCPFPELWHESESSVDKIVPDLIVENDGTLEDLDKAVFDMRGFICDF